MSPDDEATLRANLSRLRESCDELVMRLCRDLGTATTTCEMVKIHTKVFPPSRCELMLSRYGEENAHLAAEASLAAQAQGKFWALHDVMFANGTRAVNPGDPDEILSKIQAGIEQRAYL